MTTWCSPHMKTITVSLYRNYSKMFITCFAAEDSNNNFRYGKYNYGTWLKITRMVNTRPIVRSCRPGYHQLFPSTLYIFALFTTDLFTRQHFFRKTSKLSYYFYIVKYYVRHTNWYGYTHYSFYSWDIVRVI